MRFLVSSMFVLAATLYCFAAYHVYREEVRARTGERDRNATSEAPVHPEANLRRLREAFASEDYTDHLEPYLERALAQAPTFYQPPFLLAAFYANRLERPETVERSFEAALTRFPSNGRLHLTYAEWLLTPRVTAPYRAYRVAAGGERARERAVRHLARATALEPELVRQGLALMIRFRIPADTWSDVLPDDETTRQLVLRAADRAAANGRTRQELLETYLADAESAAILRSLAFHGRRWDAPDVALAASERWHRLALESGSGSELTQATLSLVQECFHRGEPDRAYRVMRSSLAAMEERGLSEDSAELLVGTGNLYLARRRLAMAQSLFTEAATRSPFFAPAHLGLAHVHQRAGDRESAVGELRRVLELDPDNNRARSLLDAMLEER